MSSNLNYVRLSFEQPNIDVLLKNSNRAKKLSIKIGSRESIEMVIPKSVPLNTALSFLYKNEIWIRSKIKKFPLEKNIAFKFQNTIPVLGSFVTITHTKKDILFPFIENNLLYLSCSDTIVERRVLSFLYTIGKERLNFHTNFAANHLGVSFNKISIKDTSTILGSCSSNRNLSFNWRVAMMPEAILRYIAIHEVCHLIEMNHSHNFWKHVKELDENYKKHKQWIKKNILKIYNFG